jgi:hypothetical protein
LARILTRAKIQPHGYTQRLQIALARRGIKRDKTPTKNVDETGKKETVATKEAFLFGDVCLI